MSDVLIAERVGRSVEALRKHRGWSKVELAQRIGITRQKLGEIEKGSLTVAMSYYCRALSALGCELEVVPRRMPTLDELEDVFA